MSSSSTHVLAQPDAAPNRSETTPDDVISTPPYASGSSDPSQDPLRDVLMDDVSSNSTSSPTPSTTPYAPDSLNSKWFDATKLLACKVKNG